jgi:hypothetical protein
MSKRIALAFVAVAFLSAGLLFVRPPQARAGAFNQTVLLIHGWSGYSKLSCNDNSMWGTVEGYFHVRGYSNTDSLGFYYQDYYCDHYITDDAHCLNWYNGNVGTVNEDIRHTTCDIAWYIWNRYTQYGTTVAVVAHSMGGILIRQIMNDTPYILDFPPYLKVSDVATAGTPHQGLGEGSTWVANAFGHCTSPCLEITQLEKTNPLMSNMNSTSFRGGFARNPQGSGGTDWTTMSSNNDELLTNGCTANNETLGAPLFVVSTTSLCGLMPGAKHFVVYPYLYPNYCHGCYLTDTNTTWDAGESYSDNNGGTWYTVQNSEHSIFTMYYAILYSTW